MTDAVFDEVVKLELFGGAGYALGMMSCGWKTAGSQPLEGV